MACFPGSLGTGPWVRSTAGSAPPPSRSPSTSSPSHTSASKRTILRALSPYGCELTLRKLEPMPTWTRFVCSSHRPRRSRRSSPPAGRRGTSIGPDAGRRHYLRFGCGVCPATSPALCRDVTAESIGGALSPGTQNAAWETGMTQHLAGLHVSFAYICRRFFLDRHYPRHPYALGTSPGQLRQTPG